MDRLKKKSEISTRIAVNRDYRPARIERELLAKVFDLVEQSCCKVFTSDDGRHEPTITSVSVGMNNPLASSNVVTNKSTEIIELEEVG